MDDKGRTALFFAAGVSFEKCGLALAQLEGIHHIAPCSRLCPHRCRERLARVLEGKDNQGCFPWALLCPRSCRNSPSNQPNAICQKNGARPCMLLKKPILHHRGSFFWLQSEGGISSAWCVLGGNYSHLLRKRLCSQKKEPYLPLRLSVILKNSSSEPCARDVRRWLYKAKNWEPAATQCTTICYLAWKRIQIKSLRCAPCQTHKVAEHETLQRTFIGLALQGMICILEVKNMREIEIEKERKFNIVWICKEYGRKFFL